MGNQNYTTTHNVTVKGLETSEKVTAVSSTGQWIDIQPDGRLLLSGTSFPVEVTGVLEIINQPQGKTCTILPEAQEISYVSGNENVQWVLKCLPVNYYSVSGVVSGLVGNNVKLQLNNYPSISISSNGFFKFEQILQEKINYEVMVTSQPRSPDQLCAINKGKGVIEKNVQDIEVVCSSDVFLLTGTITGQKSGLKLLNSNGEILYVNHNDSNFSFSRFIPSGSNYTIEVQTQPYGQECYILNGSRRKIYNTIRDINVICNDVKVLPVPLVVSENDKSLIGSGKYLHLWFYLDRNQVVYPTFKKSILYINDSNLSLNVPVGTWYIRAFIDMDMDQKPAIGVDFQSRLIKWTGDQSSLSISLENTFHDSGFQYFNAYVMNTSEWFQPRGGKCGGVYLRFESINFNGNKNHISPIYVILPDNQTVEMFDDGGCGDSFNNNASSYDRQSGDGQVTAGIDQSYGIQSGTYTFYYVNYLTDKIHIVEDIIRDYLPMSSFIYLINPTGANSLQSPNPEFQWNAIAGAESYEILLESTDHSIDNYSDPQRFTKGTTYFAPFSLPDQKAYKVNIQAFDTDITENIKNDFYDFDAVSQSPDQFFITDFSGNNSIKISGKISNSSGSPGSYLIYGDSNIETGSWESSIFLPPDSNAYSLSLFKNSGKFGALISGINVDQSGYIFSNVNRAYSKWSQSLNLTGNLMMDLAWNRPLLLIEPLPNDHGLGEYPVFSWEDYSPYAPAVWSYILWITPYNSHGNPYLIGLDFNRIDLRHLNFSSYYNLSPLYQCTLENKSNTEVYSTCGYNDENTRLDGIKEQSQWEWKVMIVPCNFQEYKSAIDNDGNGRSDYIDCVLKTFSGEKSVFTESISSNFSTY